CIILPSPCCARRFRHSCALATIHAGRDFASRHAVRGRTNRRRSPRRGHGCYVRRMDIATPDYRALLDTAIEEARTGLAEGGIPIGAALYHRDGRLLGC